MADPVSVLQAASGTINASDAINKAAAEIQKATKAALKQQNDAALENVKITTCQNLANVAVDSNPALSKLPSDARNDMRNFYAKRCMADPPVKLVKPSGSEADLFKDEMDRASDMLRKAAEDNLKAMNEVISRKT
jgi:hypothetical protein